MKKRNLLIGFLLLLGIIALFFFIPKNVTTDLRGLLFRALHVNVIHDTDAKYDILRLQDDYLTFAGAKEDATIYSEKIVRFSDWLQKEQIPFLFVQAPHKIPTTMQQLPNGNNNFFKENADSMLHTLSAHAIPTLDLRTKMNELSFFFKTDHHWKPEAGLLAAKLICETLNERFAFQIDISLFDKHNFKTEVIPHCLLGSQGKKVGKYYAGLDDFTVMQPLFDTAMQKQVPIMGIDVTGSFAQCFSDNTLFQNADLYKSSPYTFYTSDYNIELDKNFNVTDSKKVLIIRDSFGCVLTPFLALGISDLHVMDVRYYKENVYQYITDNRFDLVIFETNPGYNQTQFLFIK